jgi:hypothetical protein
VGVDDCGSAGRLALGWELVSGKSRRSSLWSLVEVVALQVPIQLQVQFLQQLGPPRLEPEPPWPRMSEAAGGEWAFDALHDALTTTARLVAATFLDVCVSGASLEPTDRGGRRAACGGLQLTRCAAGDGGQDLERKHQRHAVRLCPRDGASALPGCNDRLQRCRWAAWFAVQHEPPKVKACNG